MRREEYAAAEELLSALSDRWPHRDALQAGLLRRTGRGEEAAELLERRLLNAATEVYESLVSLQELALQAERLEDGARLAALIEETVERYALIPGVASSGRLQQAAAEGDKTAALSALRDMLEALNRSWDGGGLYPHLLPGTQVAVGSVLLPGLLLELQREPELAFLQDEPELEHLLDVFDGQPHHLVSIPRDIAQYVVVAQRYQRLTDRALAAAVFFHQCFFIQHLVGPVLLGNDAFQDRVIDGVLEAVLALHGRLLLCGGSVSGPGLW